MNPTTVQNTRSLASAKSRSDGAAGARALGPDSCPMLQGVGPGAVGGDGLQEGLSLPPEGEGGDARGRQIRHTPSRHGSGSGIGTAREGDRVDRSTPLGRHAVQHGTRGRGQPALSLHWTTAKHGSLGWARVELTGPATGRRLARTPCMRGEYADGRRRGGDAVRWEMDVDPRPRLAWCKRGPLPRDGRWRLSQHIAHQTLGEQQTHAGESQTGCVPSARV